MGKKLLDIMKDKIRFKHYSISTERTYVHWAKRYILFHNKRHPKDMGKIEIERFLTHLATKLNVSPTTQNQASLVPIVSMGTSQNIVFSFTVKPIEIL